MAREESSSGWLSTNNRDDILTVEVPLVIKEFLVAIIMIVFFVLEMERKATVGPHRIARRFQCHVLGIADGPAGERSSCFLDVLLRVIADPHRKQFEQFAAVILVD